MGLVLIVLIIIVLISGCLLPVQSPAPPEERIFRDNFSGGKTELRWVFYPYFNQDNLEGSKDAEAPDRDSGVGVLKNANAGGFASLSYAATGEVSNFYLEAMVYCPVTKEEKGQLSGIAFLIDPIDGNFYRYICDFKASDPTLNIAYVGEDTDNFPVYLKFWGSNDIPGGVPKEGGWHKMALRVRNGEAAAYWDEKAMSGGMIAVDKVPRGFTGVYANYVGGFGNASTRVDNFVLKVE